MIEINSAAIGGISVAVIGGIGWFLKRIISGERVREKASLYSSYASIAGTMKAQGLEIKDVEAIATAIKISNRKSNPAPIEDSSIYADADIADTIPNYWTQSAINTRASAAARLANARLNTALTELYTILSDDELSYFKSAQARWEKFKISQSKFAANQAAGGSVESLLFHSEQESQTLKRLSEINEIIDSRKSAERF